MSEFKSLYVVLVVVYLLQCFHWAPLDSVVFRSGGWVRWQLVRRAIVLASWKRKGLLMQVLPPLGSVAIVYELPIVFSKNAISAAFADGAASPELQLNDKLEILSAEKSIMAHGKILAKACSATQAYYSALLLQQIVQTPVKKREARIGQELGKMLDTRKIEKRLRRFRQLSGPLRLNSYLLFFYLFVIGPVLVRRFPIGILWPPLVAMLVGFMAIAAIEFYRLHKFFYPDERENRWTLMLPLMLSPVAAVRALDPLWNNLFQGFHPVAVAKALCDKAEFQNFAARYFRELQHPLPTMLTLENETQRYFRERSTQALRKMLAAQPGVQEIIQPPEPESEEYAMYCPRCWNQYHSEIQVCRDCADMPLERFSASANSDWKN